MSCLLIHFWWWWTVFQWIGLTEPSQYVHFKVWLCLFHLSWKVWRWYRKQVCIGALDPNLFMVGHLSSMNHGWSMPLVSLMPFTWTYVPTICLLYKYIHQIPWKSNCHLVLSSKPKREWKNKNLEFALACIHGHVEDNNMCSSFEQAHSFPSGLMPQFCVGLATHLPCCLDLLNGLSDVTSHGKLSTHAVFPHPLPIWR